MKVAAKQVHFFASDVVIWLILVYRQFSIILH